MKQLDDASQENGCGDLAAVRLYSSRMRTVNDGHHWQQILKMTRTAEAMPMVATSQERQVQMSEPAVHLQGRDQIEAMIPMAELPVLVGSKQTHQE